MGVDQPGFPQDFGVYADSRSRDAQIVGYLGVDHAEMSDHTQDGQAGWVTQCLRSAGHILCPTQKVLKENAVLGKRDSDISRFEQPGVRQAKWLNPEEDMQLAIFYCFP
jgi:hypothetical protein